MYIANLIGIWQPVEIDSSHLSPRVASRMFGKSFSSIMFDYQTNRTTIQPIGWIEFDWFLVWFHSGFHCQNDWSGYGPASQFWLWKAPLVLQKSEFPKHLADSLCFSGVWGLSFPRSSFWNTPRSLPQFYKSGRIQHFCLIYCINYALPVERILFSN